MTVADSSSNTKAIDRDIWMPMATGDDGTSAECSTNATVLEPLADEQIAGNSLSEVNFICVKMQMYRIECPVYHRVFLCLLPVFCYCLCVGEMNVLSLCLCILAGVFSICLVLQYLSCTEY